MLSWKKRIYDLHIEESILPGKDYSYGAGIIETLNLRVKFYLIRENVREIMLINES